MIKSDRLKSEVAAPKGKNAGETPAL